MTTKTSGTPMSDKMWVTGIALVACAGLAGSLAVKNAEASVAAQAKSESASSAQAAAANTANELARYKASLDAREAQLKEYSQALAAVAQQMETAQTQMAAQSPISSAPVNVAPPVLKPEVVVQAAPAPAQPAPQPQTTTKGS